MQSLASFLQLNPKRTTAFQPNSTAHAPLTNKQSKIISLKHATMVKVVILILPSSDLLSPQLILDVLAVRAQSLFRSLAPSMLINLSPEELKVSSFLAWEYLFASSSLFTLTTWRAFSRTCTLNGMSRLLPLEITLLSLTFQKRCGTISLTLFTNPNLLLLSWSNLETIFYNNLRITSLNYLILALKMKLFQELRSLWWLLPLTILNSLTSLSKEA